MGATQGDAFDYVVVGSGAGGGTVAARLAEAGMSVLVLEAGGDPATVRAAGLPEDYDVPAFHPFASENKAMAWNYRVHDFGDDAERRPGADACGRRGVLYPRASTLGGCTAHNAMILIVPDDSDWNAIADLTGDSSWRAEAMRRYLPAPRELPPPAVLALRRPHHRRTRQPDGTRLGWMARRRGPDARRGVRRSTAG